MEANAHSLYFVIPLSVQPEEEFYLVGNQAIDEFYQFEKEGLWVIKALQEGLPPADIQAKASQTFTESIDIEAFIEFLLEIGFILPWQERHKYQERLQNQPRDRRWLFQVEPRFARRFFSPLAIGIYVGLGAYALAAMILRPALRPDFQALFFPEHQTLTILVLLLLNIVSTLLHELGHMMAAAREGVTSRLGFGNRLWTIVAESDLSGIMSLPKQRRYLPLLAGMLTDGFTLSVLTLSLQSLLHFAAPILLIQATKAWILQILMTVAWQFNIFLRTDLYFVFCNYWSYPNLDEDARAYLKRRPCNPHRKHVLRIFALIWLLGRLAALGMLFFVLLPTIAQYGQHAFQTFTRPGITFYQKIDTILAFGIYFGVFAVGAFMWLKGKRILSRRNRHDPASDFASAS